MAARAQSRIRGALASRGHRQRSRRGEGFEHALPDGAWGLCVTLTAFRLGKHVYRDQLFSGQGGLYASGRWTPRGRPVVYTSASISLAVLEYTANYRRRGWVPATVLGRAVIPERVRAEAVSIDKLPTNWFAAVPPPHLQELG